MTYRIAEAKRATPVEIARLASRGISTTSQFLDAASTAEARKTLADALDMQLATIEYLASFADLLRVKGIEQREARLLIAAGIGSVGELAAADGSRLLTNLRKANLHARLLPRRSVDRIAHSIATAREYTERLESRVTPGDDALAPSAALEGVSKVVKIALGVAGLIVIAAGLYLIVRGYLPLRQRLTASRESWEIALSLVDLAIFRHAVRILSFQFALVVVSLVLLGLLLRFVLVPILSGPYFRFVFHEQSHREMLRRIGEHAPERPESRWMTRAQWFVGILTAGLSVLVLNIVSDTNDSARALQLVIGAGGIVWFLLTGGGMLARLRTASLAAGVKWEGAWRLVRWHAGLGACLLTLLATAIGVLLPLGARINREIAQRVWLPAMRRDVLVAASEYSNWFGTNRPDSVAIRESQVRLDSVALARFSDKVPLLAGNEADGSPKERRAAREFVPIAVIGVVLFLVVAVLGPLFVLRPGRAVFRVGLLLGGWFVGNQFDDGAAALLGTESTSVRWLALLGLVILYSSALEDFESPALKWLASKRWRGPARTTGGDPVN
ncbi:MAG: DUF4332 domain-containing protein [Gemmatimonadetes bacterium]|nr:DUF4332 domain-containing protein [Gemmatimonadota bacterium]